SKSSIPIPMKVGNSKFYINTGSAPKDSIPKPRKVGNSKIYVNLGSTLVDSIRKPKKVGNSKFYVRSSDGLKHCFFGSNRFRHKELITCQSLPATIQLSAAFNKCISTLFLVAKIFSFCT